MVVVGPFGSAVMRYQMEFENEMYKQNYENPFTRQQALVSNIFQRREDGSFIMDRSKEKTLLEGETLDPTKKYITTDEWIDKRERYIADKIFHNWDWEHFSNYVTDPNHNIADMLDYECYKRCESVDGECTLFCPQLGICWLKERK